jgi:hypothetical protein
MYAVTHRLPSRNPETFKKGKDPKKQARHLSLSLIQMTTRIVVLLLVLGALLLVVSPTLGFVLNRTSLKKNVCLNMSQKEDAHAHPFCSLPGDPSLLLTTNVDLGDKKLEIMKGKILFSRCSSVCVGYIQS